MEITWIGDRKINTLRILYKDTIKRELNYATGASDR